MTEKEIRKKLSRMGKKLVACKMVSGHGGNISARDNAAVYVSPSGFSLAAFSPKECVRVSFKTGRVQQGKLKPSCELPMHMSCYKKNPGVKAVIHIHPPCATALSCAGLELKALFPDFAVLFNDRIPLIPYASPGSDKLAALVCKFIGKYPGLLLKNHGLLVVGRDLEEAFLRAEIAEEASRVYIYARLLGRVNSLSKKDIEFIRRKYVK